MATTTTKAQLGLGGVNAIYALLQSYGVTKTLPAPEDVLSVNLDGRDLLVTDASGDTHIPLNSDMLQDIESIRAGQGLIADRTNGFAPALNDILVHNGTGFAPSSLLDVGELQPAVQGYYGMLTDFYFTSGIATQTVIDEAQVGEWTDVIFTQATQGLFDERPTVMKDASSVGHSGTGADGDPILFSLEGLTTQAFANFRASMSFIPEIDQGQLESRLIFNRHSGASPSEPFPIEEVSLSMEQGADVDYASEPMLSFFIGDTIDTNGPGDAGSCRFQIKSSVEGIVYMRALTWYLNV